MYVAFFFIGYLALSLILPLAWALAPLWLRLRDARQVHCPAGGDPALVQLDPWYAVRMRTLGNCELRVRQCSQWPQHCQCERVCLSGMVG